MNISPTILWSCIAVSAVSILQLPFLKLHGFTKIGLLVALVALILGIVEFRKNDQNRKNYKWIIVAASLCLASYITILIVGFFLFVNSF